MNNNIFFLFFLICFINCKSKPEKQFIDFKEEGTIQLKHAQGFSVKYYKGFKILEIKNPWPRAEKSFKYIITDEATALKYNFSAYQTDGIIIHPIKKIVLTSTTHIPALELLNVEKTLVGFPGTNYVSSKKTRTLIESDAVRELGKNEGINTEILLELNPDLVIGFGVDGNNSSFDILKKSDIPVIYNGDWVEHSPLAKAEWIKFFGCLYQKEKEADSIFNNIEKNYLEAKQLAKNVKTKPSVLSGAMHNNIWFLPNGSSTEAQLLKDANVNYLWNDQQGTGSLHLNFETVFSKARHADIWLSPSNYSSLEHLKNSNPQHAMFKAFQNKTVYSFNNTTGATGGVLYYELGLTRPDIVLKDIIKICHPKLLKQHTPYFFKLLK